MSIAATPPMKSESGFLNTHHDTESGDKSAGSPSGREKSMRDPSLGSSSTRTAASRLLCKGQGRMIGVLTATNASHQDGSDRRLTGRGAERILCSPSR
jgi:hypothetical protein